MAATKEITKSQAIRDYYDSHAGAMPKEVRGALNEKYGWKLTRQMVGSVRHQMLKKLKQSKRARRSATPAKNGRKRGRPATRRQGTGTISLADLLAAKELAQRLGGVDAAKQAVDLLKKLS